MKKIKIMAILLTAAVISGTVLTDGVSGLRDKLSEGVEHSNRGEYDKAAEVFRQIIQADSGYADAHLALGIAYINMERPGEALPYLERAAELDPESRKALFVLARLYERNEDTARAAVTWERFLLLNPEARFERIARRHLERLRRQDD